ncbi:MAG: PAS domain S-box protein [Coxiellaceae bacterium]|nr:PAS domain S-box protein [Coxiellaceae bacterium]
MQYNTALGFVVGGIGCLAYVNHKKVTFICGLILVLMGALTLVQYIVSINIGLDELFMKAYLLVKTSHPGRMAPNTAVCFTLVGLILILRLAIVNSNRIVLFSLIFTGLLGVLAFMALFGYLTGIYSAYGWGQLTRMAVHTCVGFLLLTAAICPYIYSHYSLHTKHKNWFVFTFIIFCGILMLVLFWLAINSYEQERVKGISNTEVKATSQALNAKIKDMEGAIERLFYRAKNTNDIKQDRVSSDVSYYFKHMKSLYAVHLTSSLDTSHTYYRASSNISKYKINKMIEHCVKSIKNNKSLVGGMRVYGNQDIVCYTDAAKKNIAIIDLDSLFDSVFNTILAGQFIAAFDFDGKRVYTYPKSAVSFQSKDYGVGVIKFKQIEWKIAISPSAALIEVMSNPLTVLLMIFGIVVVVLMSFFARNLQISNIKNIQLQKAVEDKENSELLQKTLLSSAPQAVMIVNEAGEIVYVNDQSVRLSKYSESELSSLHVDSLLPKRFRSEHEAHRKSYFNIYDTRQMGKGRYLSLLDKSNGETPVEISITPISINQQRCVICNIVDKSEQKLYEDKINRQAQHLQLIYDITNILSESESHEAALQQCLDLICYNLDLPFAQVLKCSEDATTLSGTNIFYCVDKSLSQSIHKAIFSYLVYKGEGIGGLVLLSRKVVFVNDAAILSKMSENKIYTNFQVNFAIGMPIKVTNKIEYIIELIGTDKQADMEHLQKIFTVLSDQICRVFEKRVSQEKLVKAEQDKHLLLEYAGEGIFGVSPYGDITFMNRAAQNMSQYDSDESSEINISMLLDNLAYEKLGEESITLQLLGQINSHLKYTNHDAQLYRKGGHKLDIELTATAILENNIVTGAVIMFSDISHKKAAEVQVSQYYTQLKKSYDELDRFTYMASHGLKEPLRGICSYSNLLLDLNKATLNSESVDMLSSLLLFSARIEKLIDAMILFSSKSRYQLDVSKSSVNDIIMREIDSNPLCKDNVHIEIKQVLPTISCDDECIATIFNGLLTNAIKHNDNESKQIQVDFEESDEYYTFMVEDNGNYIPQNHFETIFEMFKKLGKSDKDDLTVGVGLSLARMLVEKHGGRLWVASSTPKGSVFCFSIAKNLAAVSQLPE